MTATLSPESVPDHSAAAAASATPAPGAAAAADESRIDGAVDPARVRLFRGPRGVLRCTLAGEKSVLRAKVVRVFPLSQASRWVSVLDAKNREVCLVEDTAALDDQSRRLVEEELDRQYRRPEIRQIYSLRNEYRTLYWDVETSLGRREFVSKWAADTIIWLGATQLMLVDVDTNRFIIPDTTALDRHSRKLLDILL